MIKVTPSLQPSNTVLSIPAAAGSVLVPRGTNWAAAAQNITAMGATVFLAHDHLISGEIAAALIAGILGILALPSIKTRGISVAATSGALTLVWAGLGLAARYIAILPALWFLSGCSGGWQDVRAAADPVAEHALPITGEALKALQASFYELCSREVVARAPACTKARDALNKAIDTYNAINDPFLD